jgi:hypothetical protein
MWGLQFNATIIIHRHLGAYLRRATRSYCKHCSWTYSVSESAMHEGHERNTKQSDTILLSYKGAIAIISVHCECTYAWVYFLFFFLFNGACLTSVSNKSCFEWGIVKDIGCFNRCQGRGMFILKISWISYVDCCVDMIKRTWCLLCCKAYRLIKTKNVWRKKLMYEKINIVLESVWLGGQLFGVKQPLRRKDLEVNNASFCWAGV